MMDFSYITHVDGSNSPPNYLFYPRAIDTYEFSGELYAVVLGMYITDYDPVTFTIGLSLWCVSNPALPSLISIISLSNIADPAYVCAKVVNGVPWAFVVFEVTDTVKSINLSNMAIGSSLSGAGAPNYLDSPDSVFALDIGGNPYIVVLTLDDDAITLISISNPGNMTLSDVIPAWSGVPKGALESYKGRNLVVGGNEYIFVSKYSASLVGIFDVSNPAAMVNVDLLDTSDPDGDGVTYSQGDIDVAFIGGTSYLFTSGFHFGGSKIFSWNISDPSVPVYLDSISSGECDNLLLLVLNISVDTIHSVPYAFALSYLLDALVAIDVSNPSAMTYAGSTSGPSNGIEKPPDSVQVLWQDVLYAFSVNFGSDPYRDAFMAIHALDVVMEPYNKEVDKEVFIVVIIPTSPDSYVDLEIGIENFSETNVDLEVYALKDYTINTDLEVFIHGFLARQTDLEVNIFNFQEKHIDLEVYTLQDCSINADLEVFIITMLGVFVDLRKLTAAVPDGIHTDIEVSVVHVLSNEDTDLEMYLWYGSPAHSIQIYVEEVIYNLDADEISIGAIRQFLEKTYGVSKIGNVQVIVANDEQRYSERYGSSILYGKEYIWQPIRIRAGWGQYLDTDVAMQFEGKILSVDTKDNYTSTFIGYDAIKDLGDFVLISAITFNDTLVEAEAQLKSLSPLHIIDYLISWIYERDNALGITVHGLKWFNFDTTAYEDVIDSVSFNESLSTTIHCSIGETTFAAGANMLDMVQELLKITGTYMYTGKDGKICFYTATPFRYTTSPTEYSGDVDAGTRHIYISRSWITVGDVYNELTWKVGAAGTILGPYTNTSSQALYGKKALEFTTSWEIDDNTVLPLASRFLTRHQDSVGMVEGNFSYVEAGEALAQDLGGIIRITDPAHNIASKDYEIVQIQRNLSKETMVFRAKDADYLQGKFFKFNSDDDEGDGLGITSANFSTNWKLRFFFFGNAYTTDPHHDGSNPGFDPDGNNNGGIDPGIDPDQWGNGLEEIFIFW